MQRIGIIGVGGFATSVLKAIRLVESEGIARLDAAVIRNPAKHPETLKQLQTEGRRILASPQDLFDWGQGKLDIISIPTGIPSHSRLAVQALEAGFNVVMEKPIAPTVQEVDAILAAEKRTGRFCAIGYQHIHTPALQMLREEVSGGNMGHILKAKTYALWPRGSSYYTRNTWVGDLWADGNWVLDGPITNANAHHLNNMLYLVDAEANRQARITKLQGELYRANDIQTYDTGAIRLAMSTGAVIHFYLTHAVGREVNPITDIVAEKATARWTHDGAKAVIRYENGVVRSVEGEGNNSHAEVFRVAIAVLEGRRSELIFSARDGRNHVLAVDLMFESCGEVVEIPASARKVVSLPNGERRVEVPGMEELVEQAYAEEKLLSEVGAPWGKATPWVSAEGYDSFPRSDQLRAFLAPYLPKP